ncbi:NADH-quinone oxidoreductase subunit NuoN [Enterobacteriaceae endosymbiont of Plateumaris sericea]|uniref:NADH-quinone oxidoreductase subunit N n=1 Tax=Enterobacteriaceae endosymbiont of Plateumaris sericea TaxID=2675797 RepID=UPI00144988BA|nr:NADH-quinone oxidoreductase subunit N [Enterobacteriaceae endosymbiont of Plateumaris sericea]QJC30094.1 NADH-quinone oxidoreductase subunit NuoN [Enterobacteriaceae endosymbiont of Plateumaris sericea]
MKNLILLLPLIIIILTIIIILISISIKRNNFVHLIITICGLFFTLLSILYNMYNNINYINNTLFIIDNYSYFYTIILLITSIITCIIAYPWLINYYYNKDEFYLLILISSIGGIVLTCSNNFISMLVSMELISIPIFGLIGYNLKLKNSLEASIKYTILSSIATSFFILGISLIYIDYGSLNFTYISKQYLFNSIVNNISIIGLVLILVSIGFKLSLVPFHLWTPDIYQGSPTAVTMFLSTFSKISIFTSLVRLLVHFTNISSNRLILSNLLIFISITSIIFGNFLAISQNNIKRLLGYSSIAHLGYILIILIYNIIIPNNILFSLETMGIYIISYILNNIGIFTVISIMSHLNIQQQYKKNIDNLEYYRGLFWYEPVLSFIMTVMFLSLAGIPITLGFISKFYLILLIIKMKLWYLVFIVILGSAAGLYYYLRVIINLYLPPYNNKLSLLIFSNNLNTKKIFISKYLILLLTIITFLLGVYPEPIIKIIKMSILIK